MRHIISILMENESGALSRVAGLFSARGYNIESLTVAPTNDVSLSRLTLVTHGSDAIIEQITKQLNKLIDVVKLVDLTGGPHIERELMLIKLSLNHERRAEVKRQAEILQGRIIDVDGSIYTLELTGESHRLDAFIRAVEGDELLEVVRSGVSGIGAGDRALILE